MKYSMIAAASVLAFGSISLAQADERSAQVHVMDTVEEVCMIGLAFGGIYEDGVGVSGLSNTFKSIGEINLLNNSTQNITGGVKCNSANGYRVNVSLAKGYFANGADPLDPGNSVDYAIKSTFPAGWSAAMTPQFADQAIGTTVPGIFPVGWSLSAGEETFRLQLHGYDFTSSAGGAYGEDITFTILTL